MDEKIVKDIVNDCISRQAAIHAICRDGVRLERGGALMITISTAKQWAVDLLGDLPSAQPERKTVDLKIEKISKHQSDFSDLDAQPKTHDKRTETHASDLISRAAVIDALENIDCSGGIGISALKCDVVEDAINAINALPPAQPERQKGEWIDYAEDGYVECPFCHAATNCDGNKDELHFCFSCGADMRGEQDD